MQPNRAFAALVTQILFVSLATVAAFAGGPFTVVADGLQNPRGLAFGPGGRLYVAQAGTGGGTFSGKITEIRYPWLATPAINDVTTGLFSFTFAGATNGVAGVSTIGNGTIYAAMEGSNSQAGV